MKWFSNAKGYGFISYQDDEEIFVHFTAIQTDGYKSLNKDDVVLFDVKEGARGLQAANVQKIETPQD
ncbi:hypothetical protein FC69_GL000949 [Latilactobacillus fuchuensis DSM 14340 = JCM 11249]|uniref:CSD domain-containing protein n=1 Tax=Latilactobacillus fuchuensis DSM 14340 = JCM 11249 TaxID=1423747 RepID=A0A0R1RYN1_9LACO|nr:hypothetical protein FC69_GL000949 [Latilactobacillus fuchuensis DSM 14340 = JCM 11249]